MSFITSRLFYILFGLLVVGFAAFNTYIKNTTVKKASFIGVLVIYVVFASLRSSSVGLDTEAYSITYNLCRNFTQAKTVILNNGPEYLFYGLVTLFSCFFKTSEIVFRFFYYSIIATCLFFSFYKQKNGPFIFALFLFLGFFNMSFSGIRQTMSIAIMTLALNWLLFSNWSTKKRLVLYYTFNIVAVGFHSSSLLMLLIPLVLMIPITKNNSIFLFMLLPFIPMIIKKGVYLASFYTYVYYGFGTYRVSITFILTLLLVCVYYAFVGFPKLSGWLSRKLKFLSFSYDEGDSKILLLIFMSLSFMACNSFSLVLPRYSMYFYLGVSIFISHFYNCFQNNKVKTISFNIILFAFFTYFIYTTPSLGLVPYSI